jgi:Cu+-exporting ATPase
MIIMMVLPDGNVLKMWFMQDIVSGLTISDLLLFILATPVQFGLGWRFFDGAFRSLVFAKTANVRYLLNIRWMYWWLSVQG